MNVITAKLKEALFSVLPITILVIILNFTFVPLETTTFFRFIIGSVAIIIGLTIFLFGVDSGITPIGNTMGTAIVKSNKILIVIIAGLLLGFFISIAEPDLHILAGQVDFASSGLITKDSIVLVVSAGIALMLAFGLSRIVYNLPLNKLLLIIYGIIFILALFTTPEFLAISLMRPALPPEL